MPERGGGPGVADIFREIDEELRQERAERLWRRYGKYVIAGAVAVVAAIAAWTGWQQYRTQQQIEAGAKFSVASTLAEEDKAVEAEALFTALGAESGTAYGTLARFRAAALRASSGDPAGAAAAFRTLADDTALDEPMRGLAALLAAHNALGAPGADTRGIADEIAPLAGEDSPWRHLALETLALIAQTAGDLPGARSHYQRIVDDPAAPANVRLRATQMLRMIAEP